MPEPGATLLIPGSGKLDLISVSREGMTVTIRCKVCKQYVCIELGPGPDEKHQIVHVIGCPAQAAIEAYQEFKAKWEVAHALVEEAERPAMMAAMDPAEMN